MSLTVPTSAPLSVTTASTRRVRDALTPGSRDPNVSASRGLPVRRHPNGTRAWGPYPRSRHPFIVVSVPVIVALYPDVIGTWAGSRCTNLCRWGRRGWHCSHNCRSWGRGRNNDSRSCSRRVCHHNLSASAACKCHSRESENRTAYHLPHTIYPPTLVEGNELIKVSG